MVERNMIREGFVKNTLTVSGTVSGTQTVSLDQIDALVDEDFVTTALTISGGEFISLDADLGARWKLDRIEYYTDDPTASGITMQISDNNLEYSPVTMTGSPPFYIGDLPNDPETGAPRYIRLTHSGSSDVDVQEWRAINDDSLVDFGPDGDQTQIEIDDAPIGKPSDIVETLTLFNRFERTATGFVFIDTTNTDADDEIQVAANSAGPFFGRTTLNARQPDVTPWEEGEFANTRVVASGAYKVNFLSGDDKGWEGTGFSTATVSGGVFVGTTSSFTPRFQIKNDFVEDTRAEPENRFTFPAKDFDTVNVRLKIPTIDPGNVVEGPRLYWRNQEDDTDFDSAKSTLAFTASQAFTGDTRTFTFDVGSVPTWSGTIRGFAVQPFELSTGTGHLLEFRDLEVVHSSGKERVALNYVPVVSGSFPSLDQDLSLRQAGGLTVINRKNIVQQPCIITKVRGLMSPATAGTTGMFLATISGSADPTVGSNYTVKRVIVISEPASESGEIDVIVERDVFWPAEPGDLIGASTGAGGASYIVGNAGDGAFTAGPINVTTTGTAQTAINADTYTINDRNYLLEYEAIAAEDFLANGTYRTPIIDGGTPPALLAVDFETSEPAGTSIDSGGNAFTTLEARASAAPPITALSLGQSTGHFYMFNDWPSVNKPHDFAINTLNGPVTTRDGLLGTNSIQNVAGAMLYHELKDELWVLNLLASGTLTNFRPTWDVFNVDTGAYIRTQTVAGGLSYAYNHPNTSTDFVFEPVGFIADYDREEIYIIQRENAFFVGAGSYYGIVLDLDGNFKEVFMRDGTIGTPTNRLETMGDVAYDGRFFYILADNTFNGSERDVLMVLRNGTTVDDRDIDFIDEVVISTIPGLSLVPGGNDPKGISYNEKNGLLYLYFENTSGSQGPTNRKPVIFALQASPDTSDIDDVSSFSFSLTTTSGNAFDSVPFRKGFRLESAGTNDDSVLITERQLPFTTSLTHISQKDMFGILQTREAIYSRDFFAPSQDKVDDFDLFDSLSFSFFSGISDGTLSGTTTVLPGIADTADPVWGTASGTLIYETIATDSVLFPTGRYGQVRYTLNANPDQSQTPTLTQSQLAQGLRVGDIPANGTRNIFLRTDIDGDKSIGDQQGRLKVFWQLSEE